jgi:hypothetical protein
LVHPSRVDLQPTPHHEHTSSHAQHVSTAANTVVSGCPLSATEVTLSPGTARRTVLTVETSHACTHHIRQPSNIAGVQWRQHATAVCHTRTHPRLSTMLLRNMKTKNREPQKARTPTPSTALASVCVVRHTHHLLNSVVFVYSSSCHLAGHRGSGALVGGVNRGRHCRTGCIVLLGVFVWARALGYVAKWVGIRANK